MQVQPPLTREQIAELAKAAALKDGYRDPVVQRISDIRQRNAAYSSKWRVSLIIIDEDGKRWHGSTEVVYLNPQSYFAEPKIKILRPAP